MHKKPDPVFVSANVVLLLILLNAVVLEQGLTQAASGYRGLYLTVPALLLALCLRRR